MLLSQEVKKITPLEIDGDGDEPSELVKFQIFWPVVMLRAYILRSSEPIKTMPLETAGEVPT